RRRPARHDLGVTHLNLLLGDLGYAKFGHDFDVAIFLTLAAALMYGVAAVLQQRIAERAPEIGRSRLIDLRFVLRDRIWRAGTAAFVAGNVLQAIAFDYGSLVVVEALLATSLLFALPLASLWAKRPLRAREWVAVVVTTGGLAGFLMTAHPLDGHPRASLDAWALVFIATGGAIAATWLTAVILPSGARAALLGIGAGIAFGVADALTKVFVPMFDTQGLGVLTHWPIYASLLAGAIGVAAAQFAYHAASLSASFPSLNVLEPVTGALIGLALFGERLYTNAWRLGADVIFVMMVIAGVVVLARSPVVTGEWIEEEEPQHEPARGQVA
ncbi:MAG: DMT family transporter, partial [Actinomycetota bacterium]